METLQEQIKILKYKLNESENRSIKHWNTVCEQKETLATKDTYIDSLVEELEHAKQQNERECKSHNFWREAHGEQHNKLVDEQEKNEKLKKELKRIKSERDGIAEATALLKKRIEYLVAQLVEGQSAIDTSTLRENNKLKLDILLRDKEIEDLENQLCLRHLSIAGLKGSIAGIKAKNKMLLQKIEDLEESRDYWKKVAEHTIISNIPVCENIPVDMHKGETLIREDIANDLKEKVKKSTEEFSKEQGVKMQFPNICSYCSHAQYGHFSCDKCSKTYNQFVGIEL